MPGTIAPDSGRALTVLSAGAAQAAIGYLMEIFLQETGSQIQVTFAPAGSIVEKIHGGETADIVVLTDQSLQKLRQQGTIMPDTIIGIGRVGVGIAVREGQPIPDISTTESFRQVLLNAKSIVYADPRKGASSGIHFANVLERLGIQTAVQTKSHCLSGGYSVMEAVAAGSAEIGVQQATEIIPVKGVTLVGMLPSELQKVTTYTAGVMTTTTMPELARQFAGLAGKAAAKGCFDRFGFGLY